MSVRWVLDTNIVSLALRQDPIIQRHLSRHDRRELAITVITWAELVYASRRSAEPARHQTAWQRLLRGLPVLAFTRSEAEEHARLRDELRHHQIGERNLMIAAIARANGLAVVTRNAAEFKRVRGLRVEEWG